SGSGEWPRRKRVGGVVLMAAGQYRSGKGSGNRFQDFCHTGMITRRRMQRITSKAFTLVELLVVIGIIALLLSILLPVISKARQSAVSLKCLSNLRQMGLAYNMYTGEHHQYLPYPTTTLKGTLATDTGEPNLWFVALDPY